MNCRERQEFFSDLYDGNLPVDRRGDLEAHLSSCADCRGEYETFSASLHALREAAPATPRCTGRISGTSSSWPGPIS